MDRDDTFLRSTEFERARSAVMEYRRARTVLRELGVLRSERTVQSDFGEWLGASLLGLTLAASGVQAGYDATDAEGRTYQIKTRLVKSLVSPTSFDMRAVTHPFDFLLGIFLSLNCELLAIIKISAADVSSRARYNRSSIRLRWTRDCWEATWVDVLHRNSA